MMEAVGNQYGCEVVVSKNVPAQQDKVGSWEYGKLGSMGNLENSTRNSNLTQENIKILSIRPFLNVSKTVYTKMFFQKSVIQKVKTVLLTFLDTLIRNDISTE